MGVLANVLERAGACVYHCFDRNSGDCHHWDELGENSDGIPYDCGDNCGPGSCMSLAKQKCRNWALIGSFGGEGRCPGSELYDVRGDKLRMSMPRLMHSKVISIMGATICTFGLKRRNVNTFNVQYLEFSTE